MDYYIILLILLIVFILLVIFIIKGFKSLKYLIENRKCFKYALFPKFPVKLKECLKLLIIVILFLLNLFIIYLTSLYICGVSPGGCAIEYGLQHKRALSALNQVLVLENKVESKQVKDFQNANEFANIIISRMHVEDVYNIKSDKYEYKTFKKGEIKKYKLTEYKDKPFVVDAGGIAYIVSKYEQGCNKVDLENHENSSCLIDVDVNGFREPNKYYNPEKPRNVDRITLVVDGVNNKVIPPNKYKDLIYDRR